MQAAEAGDSRISRYQILAALGRGGMGVVYRAKDTQLDRVVALKVLPPELAAIPGFKRRFQKEGRSASAVSHPNIAHIYEVNEADGVFFIAMEYVEGETLEAKMGGRPLPEVLILDLAIQIADALAAAHSKGITHRDVKPSNIMITPAGQVKVLDFGLAKMAAPANEEPEELARTVTRPGVILGTVQYMSPEQAIGESVDPRSDIFSLGIVLYQMATGVLPFPGANSAAILSAIIHKQPAGVSQVQEGLSLEFDRIIRKCLEKDANCRYQSAVELCVDLRNLKRDSAATTAYRGRPGRRRYSRRRAGAVMAAAGLAGMGGFSLYRYLSNAPFDSLAVLPFSNISNDPEMDYLSDGITETLINNISKVRSVVVRPRSSVARYRGREADPRAAGRELQVKAVLLGRVLRKGDQLDIGTELIDTAQNRQIWGQHYTRGLAGIFLLQEEISSEVVRHLGLTVTDEERRALSRHNTENTEAYHLYLKGRYFWNKRTAEGLQKGIEYFQQAVDKDPNFALAYSGLADCYTLQGNLAPPREIFPRAKSAAKMAIERDSAIAEPYATLGYIGLLFDWDWKGAEAAFQRALELNPNYATAHSMYGRYLSALGRFEEALAETRRAQALDPLSLGISTGIGVCFYLSRQYDRAIDQYRRTLEIEPGFALAHFDLGGALAQKGRFGEAFAEFQAGLKPAKNDAGALAELGHAYGLAGRKREAAQVLDQLRGLASQRYVSPHCFALVYAGLRENDAALEWLEKAYQERALAMALLKVEPRFDPIRGDSRFQELLRRMGFAL